MADVRGVLSLLRRARIAQMMEREGERLRAAIPDAPATASDRTGRAYSTLPDPRLRAVSEDYARQAGIDYQLPPTFPRVNPADAREYAIAYDSMRDDPLEPLVRASYDQMGRETLDQLDALVQAGYRFEFMPQDEAGNFLDPYAATPRLALEDLRDNRRMYTFPTEGGYGTLTDAGDQNPLLREGPYMGPRVFNGQPYVLNDAFRIVHDALGHGPMGAGFRARGEEGAFQHHAALYSDLARPAVAAETRGQNSFVNYSPRVLEPPHPGAGMTVAEWNKGRSAADTVYADQKAGLLPDFVYNRGLEWLGRPISVEQLRAMLARGGVSAALALAIMQRAEVDDESRTVRLAA